MSRIVTLTKPSEVLQTAIDTGHYPGTMGWMCISVGNLAQVPDLFVDADTLDQTEEVIDDLMRRYSDTTSTLEMAMEFAGVETSRETRLQVYRDYIVELREKGI